ncbi:MAG: hypothetical protein ACRC0G_12485 [Fusobacteriaceae bacterium]
MIDVVLINEGEDVRIGQFFSNVVDTFWKIYEDKKKKRTKDILWFSKEDGENKPFFNEFESFFSTVPEPESDKILNEYQIKLIQLSKFSEIKSFLKTINEHKIENGCLYIVNKNTNIVTYKSTNLNVFKETLDVIIEKSSEAENGEENCR